MKPALDAQLRRILANLKTSRPEDERLGPVVRCIRCRDTGVVEWVSGEFRSTRGVLLVASEEKPVFTRCDCIQHQERPAKSRSYAA